MDFSGVASALAMCTSESLGEASSNGSTSSCSSLLIATVAQSVGATEATQATIAAGLSDGGGSLECWRFILLVIISYHLSYLRFPCLGFQ